MNKPKGRLTKTTAINLAQNYHRYVDAGRYRRANKPTADVLKFCIDQYKLFETAQEESGVYMVSDFSLAHEIEQMEKDLAKLEETKQ